MANNEQRPGDFMIPRARLSFPKIWRAEVVKGETDQSKKRYSAVLLLPKEDKETFAKIKAYKDELLETSPSLKTVANKKKVKLCIKNGDDDDMGEECRGHWVISANRAERQGRPQVVDQKMNPLAEGDGKPYAGCYVRAFISLYVPKEFKCVAASLEGIQFLADGEPFGNQRTAESMFGAIDGDASDDDNEGEDDDDL